MWSTVVAPLLLLLLAPAQGQRRAQAQAPAAAAPQQQIVSDCPLPDGFFADAQQCDRYYSCVDNVLEEKLCADGLAFVDKNPRVEKCDYTNTVDCTGRPDLQAPQPQGACRRQNGYFTHPDPLVCDQFFFCSAGAGNMITCPPGLVFSTNTSNCVWPAQGGRTGCATEDGGPSFVCPKVTQDVAVTHPRYADPDDCQYYYICISGINPRRNGCVFGQVFNAEVGNCMSQAETPECANYYTDYFDDYFKNLGTSGKPRGEVIAAAVEAGYRIPVSAFGKVNKNQRRQPVAASLPVSPAAPPAFAPAAPAFAPAAPAFAPAARAPAPTRQSTTSRRRRPTAPRAAPSRPRATPSRPQAAPAPVQADGDTFSLSTDFGAAEVDPAPAPAPVSNVRRRRPLVSVRRLPQQ